MIFIRSLELRGRGADQGLPSSHSPSVLWQAEGAGSENESVNRISKEILCAQHSFGLCNPSPQDVVKAKTLAMTKEGFPGPWDEQEHPVLKKDLLCVFGVSRDTAQEQSPSGAAREVDPAAVLGPASAPEKVTVCQGGVLRALRVPLVDQPLVAHWSGPEPTLERTSTRASCPERATRAAGMLREFCPRKRAGAAVWAGETPWELPFPRAGRCGGPRGSPLLLARSNLQLGGSPGAGSAPSPAQAALEEKCGERGTIFREAGAVAKQPLREEPAPAECALSAGFCWPRTCPAVLPARRGYTGASGSQRGAAACPVPWLSTVPISRMRSLRREAPSPRPGRPPGGQRSGSSDTLAAGIASDRSICSARFRLNFIMVSVAMATCKNNGSPSPANSP